MKHGLQCWVLGANAQMSCRLTAGIFGKVLTAHGSLRQFNNLVGPQSVPCNINNMGQNVGRVDNRWHALQERNVCFHSILKRDAFYDTPDGVLYGLAYIFCLVRTAPSSFTSSGIWFAGRATMNGADCDNGRAQWSHFTTDNGPASPRRVHLRQQWGPWPSEDVLHGRICPLW